MLTDQLKKTINLYIDNFIDNLRAEIIYLNSNRAIEEISPNLFLVRDSDYLIDQDQKYDEIFRHPIEDHFFIPKAIDFYVIEYKVVIDPEDIKKIIDFDCSGVVDYELISIDDKRISDELIEGLVSYMCFDIGYQKHSPEVRDFLIQFFETNQDKSIKKLMDRIKPFLNL